MTKETINPRSADPQAFAGKSALWRGPVFRILRILNFAVCIMTLVVVGYYLKYELPRIDVLSFYPDWRFLGAALTLTIVYVGLYSAGWCLILWLVGVHVGPIESVAIWSFSTFGKYLPGKIANLGYRTLIISLRGHGSPQQVLLAWGIESVCSLLGGAVTLLLAMALLGVRMLNDRLSAWSILAVVAATIAVAIISLIRPVRSFVFRQLRMGAAIERLHSISFLMLTAYYAACWAVLGAVLWLIARAFGQSALPFGEAVLTYAAAGMSGMLTVIAPSGLGVREGIMILLLSVHLPPTFATVIAIAARFIATLGDVFIIVLGYVLVKVLRLEQPSDAANMRDGG